MEPQDQEGEVILPPSQPINPELQGSPAASEAFHRPPAINTVCRSMARAEGEMGCKGVGSMAFGQLPDGVVQPIRAGRLRKQPQGEGEGWIKATPTGGPQETPRRKSGAVGDFNGAWGGAAGAPGSV